MSNIGTLTILILLTTLTDLKAVTVVNHHPDDEYVLEHEVLYEDAINEAKKLHIFPGPIPGCKHCTNSEITYCENGSVINDHCCCDGSYNKVFPFVEHSCRVGPEECKVEAGDCAEYTRLRECCCHTYLASMWKYLATGQGSHNYSNLIMFLTILAMVLGLYI
ncbi:PREDICTED: uncharacterized protein LOC107071435 [Polistes dominula]|uniref:Uncharacterized protein LOC107071435 n=1 Tax=Polistes dominula TaxID=743375 RepID=A0ABM1J0D3_POLDO|nr:PREDICTED: uncharacterized protein LOC107071435 [Polistes dominula]XP_015185921.1 PREDICTED: uncharacterized protein LOC107071435 [Polistes dominula]XP_015185922.1 PREDICTED: uncharacterized protein LOC107071435 [Polistes dominula]